MRIRFRRVAIVPQVASARRGGIGLVVLALVGALVAAGVGQAAPTEATVDLSGASVGRVALEVNGAVTFRAAVGDHEIVAHDGTWTTGPIPQGGAVTLRFEAVGEYAFHCTVHAEETGVIAVEPAAPTPPTEPPPPPPNQPPEIRFTTPTDGATVKGPVELRASVVDPDAGPGTLVVRFRLDGGPWRAPESAGGGEWRLAWDASAADPGMHVWEAVATDGAAESAVALLRLRVEAPAPPPPGNEPPTITIDRPSEGAEVLPSDVILGGEAQDKDSKASELVVEVSIDGGAWQRARGGAEWFFVWDASEAEPGTHVIAVRASDGTATSEVEAVRVVVKTGGTFQPPTDEPPITSPPVDSGGWKEAALDFGWVAIAIAALSGAWAWASSRP